MSRLSFFLCGLVVGLLLTSIPTKRQPPSKPARFDNGSPVPETAKPTLTLVVDNAADIDTKEIVRDILGDAIMHLHEYANVMADIFSEPYSPKGVFATHVNSK